MSKQIVKAGTWSIIGQFTKLIIKFGVNIALARLLTPKEFGLIGMVSVIIALLTSLGELGLFSSLIQKKEVNQRELSSVFWVSILLGIAICLLLYFTAPLIVIFYHEEALLPIIRALSLIFLFNSLILTHNAILTKQLNFKRMELFSTISVVVASLVSLSLAFLNFGVWALVAQQVVASVINVGLIWLYEKWRPSFIICKDSLKNLLGFGLKVFASSIINTAFSSIDTMIIGRYFSASILGLYSYAQTLINVSVGTFTSAFVKVLFPVMSEAQNDFERLKNTYKKALNMANLFIIPAMGTIAVLANEIIHLLLGEKWLPMVTYIQLFSILGILYPISALNINILLAKGRADKFLNLEIIKKVLLVIGIGIGLSFGILGMLIGIMTISFIGVFFNLYVSGKVSGYNIKDQLIDILPIAGIAIVYLIILYLSKILLIPFIGELLGIGISFCLAIISFVFILFKFYPAVIDDIKILTKGFTLKKS
ncbi:MAG: lipopolysaccharide biosynthesis protein [Bacteroidota bacterium]